MIQACFWGVLFVVKILLFHGRAEDVQKSFAKTLKDICEFHKKQLSLHSLTTNSKGV